MDTWESRQSTGVHNRLNGTNVGWRIGGGEFLRETLCPLLFREHPDKNLIGAGEKEISGKLDHISEILS